MITCNIGFINMDDKEDETQLDIEARNREDEEIIELINLILSLKDEMSIKEITYVEFVKEEI